MSDPQLSLATVVQSQLNSVPVKDGQLIAIEDADGFYYDQGVTRHKVNASLATTAAAGIVKPDGTTVRVDANGTISADSGHTIKNPAGTASTQRSNLQFVDSTIVDDSTNNATKVQVVRQMTQAEFDQLTPAERYGVIDVTDGSSLPLTALSVGYSTATSGLSATNVQGAIDEVVGDIPTTAGDLTYASGTSYASGSVGAHLNKQFILANKSLTFSNLTATVSDSRVTANTFANVVFTDATVAAASAAGISVNTSAGTITFTATTAPATTLICNIICTQLD